MNSNKRLPKNPLPFSAPGCFLAGGSILSIATKTDISDYDVYPKSKQAMIDLFYSLEEENSFIVNVSDRAITFKLNDVKNDKDERAIVQVMTFDEFSTPEQIFEYFDFSVCMAAFDADTLDYTFHPDFWPSVASRTLYFNPKTRYPLNSAIRVGKYTSKGFYLPKSESIRLSLAVINSGMPSSWQELEDAIGGSYGKQVKLSAKDKTYSYEAALELLDGLELSYLMTVSDTDFSSITAEHLEQFFKGNELEYLEIERKNSWTSSSTIGKYLIGSTAIKQMSYEDQTAIDLMNIPMKKVDPETRFYGYKVLLPKEDGSFENMIHRTKVRYLLGEETTVEKDPHIYIWPDFQRAKDCARGHTGSKICKFSFAAKDISSVLTNEYTVLTAKFEEVVKLEN